MTGSPGKNVDPLLLAAGMFQPRTTDSFEQWALDRLGQYLTPIQRQINDSIVQHRYTAVPSAHAMGKSRYSAMKTGHFIDSHTIGSAFVVTTAPTSAQVESVLWRELLRVHVAADLRGRITRSGFPQWHIGDELVAFGRRPTEVASFQGIHERFILIILEEADGIPEPLWIAADTLASSGRAHVLAIGNPDSADSYFAKILRPGSGWNVVRADGLRGPNFTKLGVAPFPELKQYMIDNAIPYSDASIADVPAVVKAEWRDVLLNPQWVWERMTRWGLERNVDPETGEVRWRESALWLSKVRGRPPEEGSEGLIPLSWIEAAIRRWKDWEAAGCVRQPGRVIFGCDVADSGNDETVMTTRAGPVVETLVRIGQQDTETTGARLVGRMYDVAHSTACVDAVGVGVGVVNYIRARRHPVIAFNGAAKSYGRDATGEFTFANQRSEAYWHLRELLDPINGPNEIALPPIDDLITDLTIPRWKVRTGGVIEIEPKKNVVKRLRRSPDCGDAVVMTFWPSSSSAAKRQIHSYSTGGEIDDWAPDPEHERRTEGVRQQRVRELGERVKHTRNRRIFSQAGASSWDGDF